MYKIITITDWITTPGKEEDGGGMKTDGQPEVILTREDQVRFHYNPKSGRYPNPGSYIPELSERASKKDDENGTKRLQK